MAAVPETEAATPTETHSLQLHYMVNNSWQPARFVVLRSKCGLSYSVAGDSTYHVNCAIACNHPVHVPDFVVRTASINSVLALSSMRDQRGLHPPPGCADLRAAQDVKHAIEERFRGFVHVNISSQSR